MNKFDKIINETYSKSMLKAMGQNVGRVAIKKVCDKCGFLMPKYVGKYPNFCPICGDPVDYNDQEVCSANIDLAPVVKFGADGQRLEEKKSLSGSTLKIIAPQKWLGKKSKFKTGEMVKVLKFQGYQGDYDEYEIQSLDGKNNLFVTDDFLGEETFDESDVEIEFLDKDTKRLDEEYQRSKLTIGEVKAIYDDIVKGLGGEINLPLVSSVVNSTFKVGIIKEYRDELLASSYIDLVKIGDEINIWR